MKVDDELRSVLASLFVGTQMHGSGLRPRRHRDQDNHSLCCASDAPALALRLCRGNAKAAERLLDFHYTELGCSVLSDLEPIDSPSNEERLDYYLAKIADLEKI